MRIGVRRKAAADRRDADINFGAWLPDGDQITDASASVEPEGLGLDAVQLFDDIVKVWLSGGEPGECYTVNVVVSTKQGRIKEVCFQVQVTEC